MELPTLLIVASGYPPSSLGVPSTPTLALSLLHYLALIPSHNLPAGLRVFLHGSPKFCADVGKILVKGGATVLADIEAEEPEVWTAGIQ